MKVDDPESKNKTQRLSDEGLDAALRQLRGQDAAPPERAGYSLRELVSPRWQEALGKIESHLGQGEPGPAVEACEALLRAWSSEETPADPLIGPMMRGMSGHARLQVLQLVRAARSGGAVSLAEAIEVFSLTVSIVAS